MMAEDKLWMESILRRRAYEESPLHIVDITTSDAVGKNENYLSKITKVKATLILGSGKKKKKSLMVKNIHIGEFMGGFTKSLGVFEREITMYRDILPIMQDLLDECGDTEGPMWAQCYDVRLYNRLVLEDLTAEGYRMAKRTDQLDLNHTLVAVRHIAKFHAISHLLVKRSDIPTDIFGKTVWHNVPDVYTSQNVVSFTMVANAMESWGDEWQDVRIKFEKAIPTLASKSLEQTLHTPDDFIVLNHGDCWTNNLMFRHVSPNEIPVSMKFVDFQLCFLGTVAYDLNYLLGSSVPTEIYKRDFPLIIKTYCDSLASTLSKFNYEGAIPDFDAVSALMKRTHVHYLFTALSIAVLILGDSDNVPDLEEVMKEYIEAKKQGKKCEAWNIVEIMGERGKKFVQFALRDAVETGLI